MPDTMLWFREDRTKFYDVPVDAPVPPGDTPMVSLAGERRRVDATAIAAWEIPADVARRRFTGDVEAAWARLLDGLAAAAKAAPTPPAENPLKALGDRLRDMPVDATMARAGEKLRAALASPELASAFDEVGVKLQEVAQRLREQAAAPAPSPAGAPAPSATPPTPWAAALAAPDLRFAYTSGNAAAPDSRFGASVLELDTDGAIRLANTRAGTTRRWAGRVGPNVVSDLCAVLTAAGEPPVLPVPLLPGASLTTFTLEGGGHRVSATVEAHGARRRPEWVAVYGLLQSLLLAVSGGVLRLGTDHTEIAVDDLHEV
jgi:hypothetical protein